MIAAQSSTREANLRIPVRIGDLLDGKYRLERVLGEGGMGVVLGARHEQLEQPVALKFMLPEAAASEVTRARFDREARALARMSSKHVARIMDVGTLPDGLPYIVLEHLTGRDLADLLDARGQLPLGEAVGYVLEACEALAEAHALGIVHRDVKPENLFLAERADGTSIVKVIDFGIAKAMSEIATRRSATRTDNIVGSPMYMSPEQLRNAKDVDGRSDLWSLGVTLFELLTGRGPFADGTVPELCAAVLTAPPLSLAALRPDLPGEVIQVIEKALEKDRDKRFRDVGEFAEALAPFARHTSPAPVSRIARKSRVTASSTLAAPWTLGTPAPSVSSSKPRRIVAACMVVAAASFLAVRAPAPARPVHAGSVTPGVLRIAGTAAALASAAAVRESRTSPPPAASAPVASEPSAAPATPRPKAPASMRANHRAFSHRK